MKPELYIGLMSGTSMDGVDGVLVHFAPSDPTRMLHVLAHHALPLPPALREELMALNQSGPNELHRAALAANALVRVYAEGVQALLRIAGISADQVQAIGAHVPRDHAARSTGSIAVSTRPLSLW